MSRERALVVLQPHHDARSAARPPRAGSPRVPPSAVSITSCDVADVEAVARRRGAVDLDQELRQLAQRGRRRRAPRPARRWIASSVSVASFAQRVEVVAEHLDDDLAVDLRDRLEHVVADRLRERRRRCRASSSSACLHLVASAVACVTPARHSLSGLQVDQELGHVDRAWGRCRPRGGRPCDMTALTSGIAADRARMRAQSVAAPRVTDTLGGQGDVDPDRCPRSAPAGTRCRAAARSARLASERSERGADHELAAGAAPSAAPARRAACSTAHERGSPRAAGSCGSSQ